jgi:hypothetical protein
MQGIKEYLPLPKDARITDRQSIKYPSVTTVLSGVDPIIFPEYKLRQYASRGSIVHAQAKHFLRTGKWEVDLLKIPRTEEELKRMNQDLLIVTRGNLHLRWEDCNFLGFWEKYGKDFKPWKGGIGDEVFFNDQYVYSATPDWPCLYRDEPTMVEFKTCSNYPAAKVRKFKKQMSAYAKCETEGVIKNLVLIPLNPKNKAGFGEPVIERNIEDYFNLFIEDRLAFSAIFGI